MKTSDIAKALGRVGGRARAKKLSAKRRREIASMGGRARSLNLHAEERIRENFRKLAVIEAQKKADRNKV